MNYLKLMDDKYRPRSFEEMASDPVPVTMINEPIHENVGVLVPGRQRSLHAVIAQNLKDVEGLINRLELGVAVADSGRGLIRDLYVQCRAGSLGSGLEIGIGMSGKKRGYHQQAVKRHYGGGLRGLSHSQLYRQR